MSACITPGCAAASVFGSFCSRHASGRAAQRRSGVKAKAPDFSAYRDRPDLFAVDCLGVTPWLKQAMFLRAVAQHDRVALKAGQKVSKSNSLAILKLWFACTRPGSRVFFTNSSERQVSVVNYRELRRLAKGALVPLGIQHVHDTAGRGITFKSGSEIIGFATNEVDRLGGLSGDDMMFVIDEASGVAAALWEGVEGNTAADNCKFVVCGNPLRPADPFHDIFNSRSASWLCMTISSLESPNVVEGRQVIRGLASPGYVERIRDIYGEGSPFWQARVLGEFPSHSEYNIVGLADVLAAVQRGATMVADLTLALVCGLDVARFGDDESVAVFVRGSVVVGILTFRNLDGPTLAGKVAEAAQKLRHGDERVRVNVDVIGIGASPFDALGVYGFIDAVAVNVSETPTIDDHYANLRAQLWFTGAAWLKTGAIPNDQKLVAELTAPLYSFDVKGNRKVEAKADLKKRLKRSPDRADALLMAIGVKERTTTGFEDWEALADNDLSIGDEDARANAARFLFGGDY